MNITVYGKPQCVQCDATKRELARHKIDYDHVDITQDAEALARIKSLGYVQAPVVVAGEDHWSGFRPDKIKALDPKTGAGSRQPNGLDPAAPRGGMRAGR